MPPRLPPGATKFFLNLIVAVCCLTGGGPMGFAAWPGPAAAPSVVGPAGAADAADPADPFSLCERAGAAAERANGLPPGLLLAIGRVESGRWDSARGRVTGWPWTINAGGKGQWFDNKDTAARTVRDLSNAGTRSIDVGCFQISLLYHPAAFGSLEQAFDPDANAAYAARFLLGLFSQSGSWTAAVEAYHSADPALGFAYRQQVFANWPAAVPVPPVRGGAAPLIAVASRPITMPMVIAGVQVWTPMPVGGAAGVVAMPESPTPEPSRAPPRGGIAPLPAVSYRVMPAGVTAVGVRPVRVIPAPVAPDVVMQGGVMTGVIMPRR